MVGKAIGVGAQVLTVFITSLVAGTFLNQLQAALCERWEAAAPQTAVFFMTYLLLLGLTTKPLAFLRLPQLGLFWLMDLLARSDRERERLWKAQRIDYGYQTPDLTIAILLGLVFCVIAPLITPIAFLFFLATSELFKYQLLNLACNLTWCTSKQAKLVKKGFLVMKVKKGFDLSRRCLEIMWARVSDQIFFSVLMFQLVMLGLMGIKGILSLRAATDLDERDQELGATAPERERSGDMYVEPSFQIRERDVGGLIKAAHRVDMLLAATPSPSLQELEEQMREDEEDGDEEDPREAKDWEESRGLRQGRTWAGSRESGTSGSALQSEGGFYSASGSGRASFLSASSRGLEGDVTPDRLQSALSQRLLDQASPDHS
eukprot:jgi/Botrbrau1/16750/Bobra.0277s0006.1